MKYLLLILLPSLALAQSPSLPNVNQEASKVLNSLKENPVADCIKPQMFSSQSPLASSKQISDCVKTSIKDLKLEDKKQWTQDQLSEFKSKTESEFIKLKNCWSSSSSLQEFSNCFN